MASTSEGASHDNDSSTGTPGTLGSPGSDESDVPEEFYYFRDVICPELFQENVPRNTSVLQGVGWVVEIMSTPHAGRFYNNRMTKPCFYALVDALSSRELLPQGQAARASNIEEVAILMQIVGWEGRAADARVLDHAILQDHIFPFPPLGKYYLVDAGFANYQRFLAPYRGTRYHLAEYRGQGRQYRTPYDMFNHTHSRLRNVIERCFGLLKKCFPILQWGMSS
ncbi:UNVERIFIED_CONTAM: hypothetical protein Sangu_2830400 [Sesamum angustifolium]|uniref:DDE Tnp4 domain-containing protein n=1 Tax=Sesamum angustifolium TaxID=2727405 RepID=A0AAW2IQB8_9LAMI